MTQLGSPARETGPADSGQRETEPGSRLAHRRRVLLGVGIGAALLAVGGLIGAAFVKSPAQLAASTAPPSPTISTAKVVSQVLTASVEMRGMVYPATQYNVYATAPSTGTGSSAAAGASSGSGASSSPLYISKLDVAAANTISNGKQLAEIDGEPLFVLTGTVPAWRDLTPGESGRDVTELQRALASLGYYGYGDTPGYFGAATQGAVAAYYEHLGYTPPATGGVPAADVVFVPKLPATVIAVNGATGQQPGQPFLELSARRALALTAELPPAYASQVKSGLKVTIFDETTGIHATGTVAGLATPTTILPAGATVNIGGSPGTAGSSGAAGSAGSSGSGSGSSSSAGSGSGAPSSGTSGSSGATLFVPLTVRPSAPLAAALNGENVLVTVETGQTEGPVLTVPVAAIVTTASGTSHVTVLGARGKQTEVPVQPGISENGYVQVTPVAKGALAAGDNVVVSG